MTSRRTELEWWYRLSAGSSLARRFAPSAERRALARNTRRVEALDGRHAGETIFILGSGPQLGTLTTEQRAALAGRVTIGVNRTQYVQPPTYFLSAYPSEVLLAHVHPAHMTLVHMRPEYDAPVIRGAITLQRRGFPSNPVLPTSLTGVPPYVVTYRNVALGATNLAMIMGAARIVYVGVEQQSALHYYDTVAELRARILRDLTNIESKDVFTLDHPHATFEHMREGLLKEPEPMAATEFWPFSFAPTFAAYFDQIRRHGVEPVATLRDSVVFEAGASLQDLDEALAEG